MAKLAFLLAVGHATFLYGLPTPEWKRGPERLDERAVHAALSLSTDIEVTTSYSSTIETFQSATVTEQPITGSIVTELPSGITRDPIRESPIAEPTESLAPIDSTLAPLPSFPAGSASPNIFIPMATDAPPQQIPQRDDHFVKKEHFVDADEPISTNKFYANFFLGSQGSSVWTHPYSLTWAKGHGDTWGMAVTHVEREQFAWGPGDVPKYFIGPIGIQNIVLSATELGEKTTMDMENPTAFSVSVNFAPEEGAVPILSIPCVQGMGFVTGIYNEATPRLNSGTFFRSLEYIDLINGRTYKYKITLNDNTEWFLYATALASLGAPPFELIDSATIEGPEGFVGMIQIAKNPAKEAGEQVYDSTAGAFPIGATISGSVDGEAGKYSIEWEKDGVANQTLLMFALPHHVESFDEKTTAGLTDIELVTTTKGTARGVVADAFTMIEPNLPSTIGFMPWVPSNDGNSGIEIGNLNDNVLQVVNRVGALELGEDFDKQTRLDSMYYSGKGLAKFASIIITLQELGKNSELAAAGLLKLKDAFKVFVDNKQPLPLVYDTVWKGVVSSGTYQHGDPGLDFGNTLYNDHHFHYGYFVYAAAVIGYLDPDWLADSTNTAWTNMLIRDFANPAPDDPFFPFQRSFDWYHGHSWAKGLFESGDGKDQESTSEDTFSSFAVKMWGKVTGDANMEARGNLQLAVQARSLRNYFLLSSDNAVQPKQFLPNKVTGILFENKVDHTTYFGANDEYIQGIHMLPLNPSTPYTRSRQFVQEEWDTYFSNGRADKVEGGWKGVLFGNLAAVDPEGAYAFFNNPDFDNKALDGGASLTWYLAYTAAMGGQGTAAEVEASVSDGEFDEGEAGVQTAEASANEEWEGQDYEDEAYYEDEYTPSDEETAASEDASYQEEYDQGEWSDVEGRSSDMEESYPESDIEYRSDEAYYEGSEEVDEEAEWGEGAYEEKKKG